MGKGNPPENFEYAGKILYGEGKSAGKIQKSRKNTILNMDLPGPHDEIIFRHGKTLVFSIRPGCRNLPLVLLTVYLFLGVALWRGRLTTEEGSANNWRGRLTTILIHKGEFRSIYMY